VTALERAPGAGGADRWRVVLDGAPALDSDIIVLAVPPGAAATLVQGLDPPLAAVLSAIPSAPIASVALGYETKGLGHPLNGFGFLVPRNEGPRVLGALWDSSIFAGRAPEGQALIRAMVGGARDPRAVGLDDEQLVRTVRDDLNVIMGIDAPPTMTHIVRHRVGIPQYTVGHADRLKAIDRALERLPGLHVTGNGYKGVAVNGCISDATAVAAQVAAHLSRIESSRA
jgi:oxygen-dependent protoporphyrinogen oxidase